MSATAGISNYLASSIDVQTILVRKDSGGAGAHPHIDVIFSGPTPPNPTELLGHPRMMELVEQMKLRYDLIILDSPPIGMVADAQILAPLSDIVLYIVRQGYTFKNQLTIHDNLKKAGKIKNIYLVLNDVMQKRSQQYGYGNGNGYGYGYGYYNEEPSKRRKTKQTNKKSDVS